MRRLYAPGLMLLLTTLLLAACGLKLPRTVVIVNPVVEAAATDVLTVAAVELTGDSTVLRLHVEFPANHWIRVSSETVISADGVSYPLVGAEGITPDSLLWMPDSGRVDFSLTFPPLPASTESIDFIEQGDWRLWGIDVTGRRTEPDWLSEIPKAIREHEPDFTAEIPEVRLDTGTTTLDVQMLGFRSGMPRKLMLYVDSPAWVEPQELTLTLDSLGRATAGVWLGGTSICVIHTDDGARYWEQLWLAPGEKVQLWLMPFDGGRKGALRIWADGVYADLSAAFATLDETHPEFSQPYDCTAADYTAALEAAYKAEMARIDSMAPAPMVRDLTRLGLQDYVMECAACPPLVLGNDFLRKHGWEAYITAFADSVRFTELDSLQLNRIGALFDTGAPELMLFNGGRYDREGVDWTLHGASTSLPSDMKIYRAAYIQASEGHLTDGMRDTLQSLSSPFFLAAATGVQQQSERILASGTAKIMPTPEVAPDRVLDAILAPHKGKVVVVDLWNTWCGPCRAALAENEPLKSSGDLATDDVVWVYIANESSPKAKYVELIQDIKGLHYRLDSERWRAITDRFGVDGIPYYLLVQRDGTVAGRPDMRNHELYKSEITKALNGK